MAWITEIRTTVGGMIRDLIKRNIPKNKYWEAENIALTPSNKDSSGGATVNKGSVEAFEFGRISVTDTFYKAWRIYFDLSAANIAHNFTYSYFDGVSTVVVPFTITSVLLTPALRYADLVSQIEAAAGFDADVYIPATPVSGVVEVGFRMEVDATLLEDIAGTQKEIIILKEYLADDTGYFEPLKSFYLKKNLFVLSTNDHVLRLGVGQKDYSTGTWTYTVLLETNQIVIPKGTAIDMDGQLDFGERVSIYFTTNGVPRCVYVKLQDTWVANSCMRFYDSLTENTDGYYIYNTIDPETGLQVLENYARASLSSVTNTGGALKTGNKQYFIRQLVGTETRSGTGLGSNQVSIFAEPTSDPYLYGNVAGVQTNKRITLSVTGLNPSLYDKFELICSENNDGVFTQYIVNTFDITASTMTVSHLGTETTIAITQAELATQQILIKNAQNLVIARNRLFLSNIETQNDYDLSDWAKTIGITTERTTLPVMTTGNVGEYQIPGNIFNFGGYMQFETYRYAIIPYYTSGFVDSPVYIDDYQILYTELGVPKTQITDGLGVATPSNVYVFYPQFEVDLDTAPAVDGKPLKDVLYGYSIVRQECIPEVLGNGYLMPSTFGTIVDTFRMGGRIMEFVETGVAPVSAFINRQAVGFYCPDEMFGTSQITPLANDNVYNCGQPPIYNNLATGIYPNVAGGIQTVQNVGLVEFSGDYPDVNYNTLTVVKYV